MAFDVEAARKAGYTDAEIAAHLARRYSFDLKAAKSSGYADSEIISHLSNKAEIPGATTPQESKGPGIVDKLLGAGEAALTTVTGATGGALGAIGGTIGGLAGAVSTGKVGTREGADMVEQAAAEGAAKFTYAPRTEQGQEMAGAIGQVMQNLIPLAGVAPAMVPAGSVSQPAAVARATLAAATDRARASIPAATARVAEVARNAMPGRDAAAKPTPGTFGSVGAAGADMAGQRIATAEALPVPIRLTKGQATRDFEALRFEGETAKNPNLGAPLRERSASQNAQLAQNFEALIDETGARATSAIETGRIVDRALVQAAAKKKAEYRIKYREADKAGEMAEPVSTGPIVDFLTENASANAPELAGASLGIAQRELIRLGGAEMVDGQLVARELPLKQVELLRRQIGNAMDAAPDNATNLRMGVMLRELIDQQTEGMGGDLYKQARSARRRYAQLFEDNAVVRDLLRTRRGTADRQVALEDVFRRSVLNGDRASVGMLRRTLQVAGGEEGAQAWRELQGATARHLLDEATKGVGTDMAGQPIFSAAKLNNAVRALDTDGRLDFLLTKKGAQTVRDLNEIAKVVLTMPPGTVNTSNTASVLLAALAEAGVSGSLTGLPLPILTGLRALSVHVKDRRIRQRVQEALREETARSKTRRGSGSGGASGAPANVLPPSKTIQ